MSPPKLTPKENALLDQIIDTDIDFREHEHLKQIPPCLEGLCDPDLD